MVVVIDLIWGISYYNMSNFVLFSGFNLFEPKKKSIQANEEKLVQLKTTVFVQFTLTICKYFV